MPDVLVRNGRREDLPALAALCAASLEHDDLSEHELDRHVWGDPDHSSGLLVVAERGSTLVAAGHAVVRTDEAGAKAGYTKLFAVRPDQRRQGLGRQIVERLEGHLVQSGVTEIRVGGSAPCYIWAGVDVQYTAAFCLLRALGYHRYSDAVNMTVDLSTAELDTQRELQVLSGKGVLVRRLQNEDLEAFSVWLTPLWGKGWLWESCVGLSDPSAGCHVAIREGKIIAFSAYGANRANWFGPMGTDPAARQLGIGGTLLKLCLQDIHANGHQTAEISWTGPIHFYAKAVGARMRRVFWLMKKEVGKEVGA